MGIRIVLGLQWGDEGKGKIIDLLSSKAKFVVRAQGGNNAGHSVKVSNREYKFHLIPSGILYPHTECFLGSGTVIDLEGLSKEMDELMYKGIKFEDRFWISPYAHIVLDYHKKMDNLFEKAKGEDAIGTTGKGIGPCYMDRAARLGLRTCDLLNKDFFAGFLTKAIELKNREMKSLFGAEPINPKECVERQMMYAEKFKPFISSFETKLYDVKEPILLEGAQGTLLDLSFGTYPYVTSSNTVASGVCLGAGVPPNKINAILGVIKAYNTRVGEGPFPTEFLGKEKGLFNHQLSREFGTTTGRKRRVGWFDGVLANFAIKMNGVTELALTKLDILDSFEKIKICVGYKIGDTKLESPPANLALLQAAKPIYKTLPGWKCSTQGITEYDKLPTQAKAYIDQIKNICKTDIKMVSTGPAREETIIKGIGWK